MADSRMYEGCSKSIRPLAGKNTFTRLRAATLIPFEVVSLWLNTLLPAVPPLFEAILKCPFANGVQLGHRVPYNVVSWLKSSPFQPCFRVGEQPKIARSNVGRAGGLSNHKNVVFGQESFESVARNELVLCHDAAATFRGHSPHGQIIRQNGMYRANAYPHLLRKFSDGDTMVLHDQSPHLVNELIISACWGPTGTSVAIHRCAAIFELVYHSLICVMPMASSPKTRWIFRMVSTWLSPSFWQNLMQWRCSSRSVTFAESNNAMHAAYTLSLTRWLHATDAVCWRENKTRMCVKVPSIFLPQHTCASLVFAEKKSHRILFEQATYFT